MKNRFSTVAIAGTFDRLHAGHERFLCEAFRMGELVVIGVMSDDYATLKVKSQKSKSHVKIQTFTERKKYLQAFLKKEKLLDRADIEELNDIYGPAIDPKSHIEALLVTRDTLAGARMVNKKRRELGLDPLGVRLISFVLAKNKRRIASTKIRRGDMDRTGRIYLSLPLWGKRIPENVRAALKHPQGKLIPGDAGERELVWPKIASALKDLTSRGMVITVGDAVTKLVARHLPKRLALAIVDLRENRRALPAGYHDHAFVPGMRKNLSHLRVKNAAGFITKRLAKTISGSIRQYQDTGKPGLVEVIGEEDLAAMPAILLAPLGSVVIYGQPGEGIVIVEVTEEKKEELIQLLNREV